MMRRQTRRSSWGAVLVRPTWARNWLFDAGKGGGALWGKSNPLGGGKLPLCHPAISPRDLLGERDAVFGWLQVGWALAFSGEFGFVPGGDATRLGRFCWFDRGGVGCPSG